MILVPYNPIAFSIFNIEIRWYGIIYALSLLLIYFSFHILSKKNKVKLNEDDIDNYFILFLLANLIGARLFDFIFYYPSKLFADPLSVLYIWNGGLSFHGGLIGILIATYFYSKYKKVNLWPILDLIALIVPLILAIGRIGNFINHELVGKIWQSDYCFNFATISGCRYPSQLFESFYSTILFIIMIYVYKKKLPDGLTFFIGFTLYGLFRFIFNFFRDDTLILLNLSMGQILSLLMFIFGLIIIIKKYYSDDD